MSALPFSQAGTKPAPPPQPALETARSTYRWDIVRGSAQGTFETLKEVFILLIAIKVFGATEGHALKPFIPAAIAIGLLLNPLSVTLVARTGLPVTRFCALYSLFCGACLFAASVVTSLSGYVLCWVLAAMCIAQIVPLMSMVYATNYSGTERGKRTSTTIGMTAIFGALIYLVGGVVMERELSNYVFILWLGAAAAVVSAFAYWRMPGFSISPENVGNPWENLGLAWRDKLFGWLLIGWMFMGIGNLMTMPLRIEYIANAKFGINADIGDITVAIGVTLLVTRILFIKVWGYFFDKLNFIYLRLAINLLFFFSILVFFHSENLWLLGFATVLQGMAMAGGTIVWQLWVTKIAVPGKVAAYMSVHSATTGVRGVLSPFIGYFLLAQFGPRETAWLAMLFIFISCLVFIPARLPIERRHREHLA